MTDHFPARIRAWLADLLYCDTPLQTADAMADATRWGWLPALSGVAVGAEHAREKHLDSAAEPGALSG